MNPPRDGASSALLRAAREQTKAGGNHCLSQRMITAGHLAEGFTPGRYVLDGEGGLVDWTTEQPARNEQRAWLPGKCRTCDT